MKYYILILSFILLVNSCGDNNIKNDEAVLLSTDLAENTHDSLVHYYEQTILDYYNESNTNQYEIPFKVTGIREFEDDSVLTIAFEEILEFGSWHYTNSSLLFIKNGSQLLQVSPMSTELKILNSDFYERDIQYPNRIPGKFKQKIDLTGDGKSEYIFQASGSIQTNFEESYNFYQLDPANQTLEIMDLAIFSSGVQAECETTYGTLKEYKIIENDTINPIIEIKENISVCNDRTFEVEELSSHLSYYTWNEKESRFIELLPPKL